MTPVLEPEVLATRPVAERRAATRRRGVRLIARCVLVPMMVLGLLVAFTGFLFAFAAAAVDDWVEG